MDFDGSDFFEQIMNMAGKGKNAVEETLKKIRSGEMHFRWQDGPKPCNCKINKHHV